MTNHKCQYRSDDSGWSAILADWGFVITHLLGTVAITLSLLTFVDDRIFPIRKGDFSDLDSQSNAVPSLTQSTVTSIISLALVYHRLAAGSWLTLAGWRMAFIVLEADGASLNDLGHMINYRCPPFYAGDTSRETYLLPKLWVIFLLATPSLFVSPLLTGAVNWIPTQLYQHSNDIIRIPQPGPSNNWNENNLYPNNRLYEVYNAVGLASTATSLDFNLSVPVVYKRYFPWFPVMPPNSNVANVTVPIFRINNFHPIRDESEMFEDFSLVDSVITNTNNSNQNFSANNLFSLGSDAGRLAIVQTKPWQAAETVGVTHDIFPGQDYTEATFEYPVAAVVTERKLVMMAMLFHDNCTSQWSTKFGSFQDIYTYESVANGNHQADRGCYGFFDVNYTAGVATCVDCPVQSDGVAPGGLVTMGDASAQIMPHPLVETALAMMNDVMFYTEIANSSFGPTYDNMEGYIRGMMSMAYQASWSCLARSFVNDSFAETTYRRPVSGLVAHLSRPRVISWGILNALLTVSACLLHMVRRDSNFKPVIKPYLTALFLDTSLVIINNIFGLCNARKLNEKDQGTYVKLVCQEKETEQSASDLTGELTEDSVGKDAGDRQSESAYKHPVLVTVKINGGNTVSPLRRKWLPKIAAIFQPGLPA